LGAAQSFGLISSSTSKSTPFYYFKHALGSRELANVLQTKHNFLQKIYAGSWDATNKKWIKYKADETSIRQRIKHAFHYNTPRSPDIESLASYIGGTLKVGENSHSPFYTITVKHTDREFALYILETVTKEADNLIGERDRRRRALNRRYLEGQLEKAALAEVRSALFALLMQEEQKSMLVNSDPPFSIQILEAPWVSKQPNEPQLVGIIGVPAAIAFALILVIATAIISFRLE